MVEKAFNNVNKLNHAIIKDITIEKTRDYTFSL